MSMINTSDNSNKSVMILNTNKINYANHNDNISYQFIPNLKVVTLNIWYFSMIPNN
jgi:hypothetical protein